MVIKHTGAAYQYEGMTFAIGQRIYANGQSDWEGLFGVITEIRTDGDKETENETADIYCSFDVPVLPADVTELEKRFSRLYREPKTIEDISLDEVIMAPEMIEPLEPWTGREKKNVWAVVVDWSWHGEHGHLEEICTDYPDAKRKLTEYLSEEFDSSTLLQWQADDRYAAVSGNDSYECYEKEDYRENHYNISIEKRNLVLDSAFIREMYDIHTNETCKEDVISSLKQCEKCNNISDWQFERICRKSDLAYLLDQKLSRDDSYWESYWNNVNLVVDGLVEEYTKEKPICYQPETDIAYPLCIGNGEKECENCSLFVDFGEGDDAIDK